MRLLAGRALRLSVALAGMLTAAGAFAHAHLQYTVAWHVVSVDGHKTKGQYTFSVK